MIFMSVCPLAAILGLSVPSIILSIDCVVWNEFNREKLTLKNVQFSLSLKMKKSPLRH
jgi:hypothetical protein